MPPISWDHGLMLACCVQFDYLFQSPSKAPHGKWSTKLLTSTIKLNWRPCWFTPSSSQSHFTICNIFIPLLNSHFVEWLLVLLIFPLTESSESEAVKWIWISSLAIFMLNWYCILFATPQIFFFRFYQAESESMRSPFSTAGLCVDVWSPRRHDSGTGFPVFIHYT